MSFFKKLMPGAEQRRAEKLADTVRDIIIGQQTASLLYASGSTLSDGTVINTDAVLAIATTPVKPGKDRSGEGATSAAAAAAAASGELADGRRIAFSPSTKPTDGALMAAAVSLAETPDSDNSNNNDKIRKSRHKHRKHKHRHHHSKNEKQRRLAQQKALKRLQKPDTLSAVLDILRLMPNPFKTQSLMQQMFQHDWRSMSMPDLLAEERANTIGRHGQCGKGKGNGTDDSEDDDDMPPESIEAHTYWWGYEIYIPPRTLQKLEDEGDVATGVLYFLGALSKTVPLIYPFVNMIATFVAMQFTIIKAADRGNGIILVATWVLPIVLIPKPWEDRFRETLRERIPIDM
ncbi:hypothetical protein BDF22DRAFT_742731 [Syncephalis plumigaleata]|nr:hypothetical protein BDF22DRAFT_742731 [Syncephalis plumigaleata]